MKCQILFSVKNKKNIINLLSAEVAQIVVCLHNVATVILLSIGTKKCVSFGCGSNRCSEGHGFDPRQV